MSIVLRVVSGPQKGQEYRIDSCGRFLVGRSSRADFPVAMDLALSREHFQLESAPPLCHLVDLGSTNGTKVNGLRVERVLLREGDIIDAGDSSFQVHFTELGGVAGVKTSCVGCGEPLDLPSTHAQGIGNEAECLAPVLCATCEARRSQFPETNPDYLIEEVIGEGGMGMVYRARQLSRNRPVAIKMILANSSAGEKAVNYFQREIHALRDMLMPGGKGHPGIIEFYELFQIEGHFQLVMEYVDGKNAREWVRALKQPLPIASAALIGQNLLSALHYAHSKGYVHRDIKPSNLLVMGPVHRPRVKLSDFGLAKNLVDGNVFSNLTRQGDVGGSLGFLSPEHIRQFGEVKESADIYSAGATLYFLLTENYPYLGFDPHRPDSFEMILEHPPVPLRAFRPDAPQGLERILQKALKKRPQERWKSAWAMSQALRALATSTQPRI
ncbi:MAG: protein kinase domain-containing protein [Isosphaeraceae bacterium]